MLESIAKRLHLEPQELRDAVWLGATLFTITCSYTLVKTARDSLYLSQLPARHLPYIYLGVGVITLAVSAVFARLTRRMPPAVSLAGTALVSAAALVAFASAFGVKRIWIPAGFYVWVNVYGLILVSQFWAFTSTLTDPREAKRIFGIVGGGGIVGGLIGGLLAGWLGQWAGLSVMTFVAAAVVAALAPIVVIGRRRRGDRAADEAPAVSTGADVPTWRPRYVRWLALMVLCSVVVTGLLDYQLKLEVQRRYPSAARLAGFFGLFYTTLNVAALTLQLVGTRLLLQRLGAAWSAFMLPAGLAAGTAATIALPGFHTVLVTRLWDQICRFSVHKSAMELFYFPLEPGLRRRAKAVIEAGLERFGDGLAGILIITIGALGAGFRESIPMLAALSLGLVLVWLVAWFQVRRHYVRELGKSLRRDEPGRAQGTAPLRERSALKELVRLVESPYERVALQGIEMLMETEPRLLERRLPKLFEHPSPRVRARALELAAELHSEEALGLVAGLIDDDDPLVRVEALRAHLALGRGRPSGELEQYLRSEDPRVRATALRCLAEFAPPEDDERVRRILEERLASEATEDRIAAVEAIGYRPGPSPIHELLTSLFEDSDLEVKRAALRSAGVAKRRDDVPVLLRALAARELQRAARDGLLGYGELVVGTLGDWMIDLSAPIEVRRMIPKVLSALPIQAAVDTLFRLRDRSDVVLPYRVLKAANQLRAANDSLRFPVERVSEDLDYDLRVHLVARLHRRALGEAGGEAERFLATVLEERRDQALNRVFRRLALFYSARDLFAAYRTVLAPDSRARGNALEFLETLLSPEHRALVMPLLETQKHDEAQALAESRFNFRVRSFRESLAMLVEADDPWVRTVALHVAGVRRERSLRGAIERALEAVDARVRESAEWALLALGDGRSPWPAR